MSQNDFPKCVRKSLLKRFAKKPPIKEKNFVNENKVPTIWIRLPYTGNKVEHLLKQQIRKVKRSCATDIKFVILYNAKKIPCYCTVKDKIPIAQRSSVIYQITFPGCLKRYVKKTDRCFHIRINTYGRKRDQPVHGHLKNCGYFQELGQLYSLQCDGDIVDIDIQERLINAVSSNCRIIDQNNKWSQLSFSESY